MALWGKQDASEQPGTQPDAQPGAQPRVYKSADFHKRRVDKAARSAKAAQAEQIAKEEQEARAQRAARAEEAARAAKAARAARAAAERDAATDGQASATGRQAAVTGKQPATTGSIARPTSQTGRISPAATGRNTAVSSRETTAEAVAVSADGTQSEQVAEGAPSAVDSSGVDEYNDDYEFDDEPLQSGFANVRSVNPAQRERKRVSGKRIAIAVFAGVLAVLIILTGVFCWNRWLRFDDRADVQGSWFVYGTNTPVEIDKNAIRIKEDVSYRYQLDPHAKTISFTFGGMDGAGRYWFANDRTCLIIEDGKDFSAAKTFFADLGWTLGSIFTSITGAEVELPSGDGYTVLSRTSVSGQQAATDANAQPGELFGLSSVSDSAEPAEGENGDESGDEGGGSEEYDGEEYVADEEYAGEENAIDEEHVEYESFEEADEGVDVEYDTSGEEESDGE